MTTTMTPFPASALRAAAIGDSLRLTDEGRTAAYTEKLDGVLVSDVTCELTVALGEKGARRSAWVQRMIRGHVDLVARCDGDHVEICVPHPSRAGQLVAIGQCKAPAALLPDASPRALALALADLL